MKKLYVLLAAALLASVFIVVTWKPASLSDHLIKDKAAKLLPGFAGTIRKESPAVDAVLLHYAHAKNKVPLYVAEASLLKYPGMANEVLPLYGDQPQFEVILSSYGSSIIPPIYYFVTNSVPSVEAMYYSAAKMHEASKGMKEASQKVNEAKSKLKSLLGFGASDKKNAESAKTAADNGNQATHSDNARQALNTDKKGSFDAADRDAGHDANSMPPLTPTVRGWFAINFIRQGGHDFLSQFAIAKDGHVTWIQSERVLQDLNSFFASGIRKLDVKYQTGQHVTAGDVGWAAADVIGTVGGLKILKLGKAAETAAKTTEAAEDVSRTARAAEDAGRVATVAEDTSRTGKRAEDATRATKDAEDAGRAESEAAGSRKAARMAQGAAKVGKTTAKGVGYAKYAKWPLVVATGWLVLNHPSVISDLLAGLAHVLGLPAWLVQFVGWFVILLPLLYVGSWVLKYLIRPSVFVLRITVKGLLKIERSFEGRTGTREEVVGTASSTTSG